MYKCLFEPITDDDINYFCINRDIHGRETRNADALYVPWGRLDGRRSSVKIYGSDLWHPLYKTQKPVTYLKPDFATI